MRDQPMSQPYARLPLLMLAITAVALLIAASTLYAIERRLVAMSGETLALAAADIADKLDLVLYERAGDTQAMAKAGAKLHQDHAGLSGYLASIQQAYPIYLWLGVTDRNGRITAATYPGALAQDRSQEDWFQAARQGMTLHVQDPQVSELAGGVMAIAFTAPLIGPQDEFLGVVTGRVGLASLEDLFARTVRIFQSEHRMHDSVEWVFLARDGSVLGESRMNVAKGNLLDLALPSARLSLDPTTSPGYIEEQPVSRPVPVVTGYAHTNGYGRFAAPLLGVLVREDRSSILASIRTPLWKLGAAGAVALIPLTGLLLWSATRLKESYAGLELRVQKRTEELSEEITERGRAEDMLRQAQEQLQMALKAGHAGLWSWDVGKTDDVYLSPSWKAQLGYADEEIPNRFEEFEKRLHPEDRDRVLQANMSFLQNPSSGYENEFRLRHKDGSYRWLLSRADLYRGTEGQPAWFAGCNIDVTERKKMEEALRHERNLSQEYLGIAGVMLLVLNADQTVRLINTKGCEILGYQGEEIIGKHWSTHFIPERERDRLNGLFDVLKAGELLEHVENAVLTKDGRERMISWHNTILRDAGGAITGTLSSGEDITERKRAEDALAAKEKRLRTILEAEPECVKVTTEDGILLDMNAAGLAMIEADSLNQVIGQSICPTVAPAYRDAFTEFTRRVYRGESGTMEFEIIGLKGRQRWMGTHAVPLRDEHNATIGVLAITHDITERRRLEDKLRDSEQQYSLLLNSAAEGIYGIDTEGRCTFINPAAAAMLGSLPEECIGNNMHALIHHSYRDGSSYPAEKCCIFNSIRTGKGCRMEDEIFWRRNGTSFPATYTAFPIIEKGIMHGAVVTFSDSTERMEMEAQAGRMERLETLGQLVGSIAHEMRNPLFMLTGRLQLLKEKLAQQEYGAAADDLKKIESSASRLTQITERFLTIAKPLDPATEPTVVQTILKQALELLSDKLMQNKIAVTAVISPDLPTIQADPRKLQEAFTHLIVNAMQAMAEAHGKGILTVTAAPQNGSIEVRIQDDGPGIAAEHRGRLFEPFFTTKPAGQGTGLGLWAARTTAMALRGTVACETGTGKGATFIMRLPVVKPSDQPSLTEA